MTNLLNLIAKYLLRWSVETINLCIGRYTEVEVLNVVESPDGITLDSMSFVVPTLIDLVSVPTCSIVELWSHVDVFEYVERS